MCWARPGNPGPWTAAQKLEKGAFPAELKRASMAAGLTVAGKGPIWGISGGPVVRSQLLLHILGASPSGRPPAIKATQPLRAPGEQEVKGGCGDLAAPHGSCLALLPPSWAPCVPVKLPRRAPHLSLQLLADGGILADVTVQADHVALKLRWGHRGEVHEFIQSSFWQPLPKARHRARRLAHIPQTHPPDGGQTGAGH